MTGLTPDQKSAMALAGREAISYREGVPDRPIPPVIGLDEAVARFRTPLAEGGISAEQVIGQLVQDADEGLNQMTSPRFFGYVLGNSHPVGVAADMLVSAWGQNAGSSFESPAISGMERALCGWGLDLLGLPAECGVGIVTGATVANTQGIMAARNALLARQGWDVEADGMFGAPEIPVLIGDAAHSAPFAALRYAGFGAGRATRVQADDEGRILVDAFERALAECAAPPLVILQAGQINSGASDPFAALIPLVRKAGGWVHVDGAFGLWLKAVPDLAPGLKGVEDADSWAVDLHKWLNAPFDAALSIVRDRGALVSAMSAWGAYLPETSEHWEPSDCTIELSRRARGVPSYAILRHLGRSGVRDMIARHCSLARHVAAELGREPGISVLNEVSSHQVAITCGQGEVGDKETNQVLDIVQKNGRVYPTHGQWRGRQIIRVSVIGYDTRMVDIDLLIEEIRNAWRGVQKGVSDVN